VADFPLMKHIGDLVDTKPLSKSLSFTSGGASDNATFTGLAVDRMASPTGSLAMTLDADIFFDATLSSGSTLSIAFDLQDSADGVNFSDYATEASAVVATGPSGGGAVQGIARLTIANADNPNIANNGFNLPGNIAAPSVSLQSARRYIRLLFTPHLSKGSVDTAVCAAFGVFAGYSTLEAPVG
jgi:hypothetical protein